MFCLISVTDVIDTLGTILHSSPRTSLQPAGQNQGGLTSRLALLFLSAAVVSCHRALEPAQIIYLEEEVSLPSLSRMHVSAGSFFADLSESSFRSAVRRNAEAETIYDIVAVRRRARFSAAMPHGGFPLSTPTHNSEKCGATSTPVHRLSLLTSVGSG